MRFLPFYLLVLCALIFPSVSRAQINAALGKPVTTQYSTSTSSATWPGAFTPANLTDGNLATFSHPNTMAATLGFKFDINLGRSYVLDRIKVYNRNDGCCPERLTKYRVSVLADNGSGAPQTPALWTAVIRADGTNSGSGGVDEILASANPAGTFTGQWIRVENTVEAPYSPQVAEVQAMTMEGVTDPNIALYKPVAFRTPANVDTPTYSGYPATNLTDGNTSSFSHPNTLTAPATPLGYYYQVDLGSDSALGRVVLYGRIDGCCQERLSNFRVSLLADNAGSPGAELWGADMHTDGSWPPTGGADTITGDMGTGSFHGRFIRVTNLSSVAANRRDRGLSSTRPGDQFLHHHRREHHSRGHPRAAHPGYTLVESHRSDHAQHQSGHRRRDRAAGHPGGFAGCPDHLYPHRHQLRRHQHRHRHHRGGRRSGPAAHQ